MSRLTAFGDRAVRFAVPRGIDERRALLERLRRLAGVRDVVVCEELGAVVFEADAGRALVEAALAEPFAPASATTTRHVVRVVYDGEDLNALDLPGEEVIRLHTGGEYHVAMLGFLPGFAYLRGLAAELRRPRRAPRPRVPARSVAIGAEYTGIYPVASAGGWHLLGRALDAPRFELGDHVTFEAATGDLTDRAAGTPPLVDAPRAAHLVVTKLAGLALFVDEGRAGQMHRGMPPGGPLVRSAWARAGAGCAIELTGMIEVEARGGPVRVMADERRTLREGERFRLTSGARRVVYLGIDGGFDAPIVEGSRNALLAAGIGRPLRRGDVLTSGERPAELGAVSEPREATERIALLGGPDLTHELKTALERGAFSVSPTSDRTGTRLVGPALPSVSDGRRPSTPMVEGAIELTPSGLVVLGPDHPTTGGYPVPALLASSSRDAFFARPLGAPVRFTFRD